MPLTTAELPFALAVIVTRACYLHSPVMYTGQMHSVKFRILGMCSACTAADQGPAQVGDTALQLATNFDLPHDGGTPSTARFSLAE